MNRHLRPPHGSARAFAAPFATIPRSVRALLVVALFAAQLPVADTVLAETSGTFTAKLTGSHEVPGVNTASTGSGRFLLGGSVIYYQVLVSGPAAITGAEIDLGPIGANGPPLFSLAVNAGQIGGALSAADLNAAAAISFDAAANAIASGNTYVNVKTSAVPAGELRGQIEPVLDPPSFTLSSGAPPAGAPVLDDIFPRSLTVGQGSIVHLVAFGQHTLTLLPAGIPADQDVVDPSANVPQGCGADANPCPFDGTVPLSVGPAPQGLSASIAVAINAPVGTYVVHSRLQSNVVGSLQVVAGGSFEISSADDIAVAIAAQLGVTPPPTTRTSIYSKMFGYDISYPDCVPSRRSTVPSPITDGFAIVGANGGRMFRYNPCLASLWNWAGGFTVRSLYVNVNAPVGPTMRQGRTGPAGTCASTGDRRCYGYNYGYNAARAAWRYAYHEIGPASLPSVWWLDVEITNTWYTDTRDANVAVIQGALDFLGAKGRYGAPSMNYTVGIYSTNYQYRRIAGSFRPGVPVWYATVEQRPERTLDRCDPATWSFTGGPVWLVQYLPGRIDANVGCE